MSGWDQYINTLTSQGISHAAIFGNDGSRWAASPDFPNLPNFKEEVPKAFSPQGSGVVVGNEKYIFLRNHEFFSIFRKANDAMAIYKMNQGFIVSIGVNQKPEALVTPTCRIGDYLKNCGF